MAVPLIKTVEATPQPRVVIAVGDCARDCGVFRGGYGVVGAVGDVVPVDVVDPGVSSPSDRHHRGAARHHPSMTAGVLVVAGAVLGLGAAAAGAVLPRRSRVTAAAVLVWGACALEAAAAIHVLATGHPIVLRSAELLPLTGVDLVLNPLGALFVLLVAMVAVPATLHGIGYARHGLDSRTAACVFPLFVTTLLLVPAPGASPPSWCCGS